MQDRVARTQNQLRTLTRRLPGSVPHTSRRPINVPGRFDGATLQACVLGMLPAVTSQECQAWFDAGEITTTAADYQPATPSQSVRAGQQFWHWFPGTIEPDVNADIEIIWDDASIIVVNKPAPLPMHPCGRFARNTLVALLGQLDPDARLRLVHRLDANTSGIVVLAKTRSSATCLQRQFAEQTVVKKYMVLSQQTRFGDNHLHAGSRLECHAPISVTTGVAGSRVIDPAGVSASTRFRLIANRDDNRWLIEAIPQTGRTNQIRIHLWHLGLPIVGDPVYLPGGQLGPTQTLHANAAPMCLHASSLTIRHPDTAKKQTFRSPKPDWC